MNRIDHIAAKTCTLGMLARGPLENYSVVVASLISVKNLRHAFAVTGNPSARGCKGQPLRTSTDVEGSKEAERERLPNVRDGG